VTDSELDQLAEKAADKAVAKMTDAAFKDIGRRTVKGIAYVAGVLTVVVLLWLANHGWIKP